MNTSPLYNGIEPAATWPPQHMDPASAAPMPVPYLEKAPPVIPIESARQLFVDDFLVEETDLERIFHQPERHPANPVLQADTPAEGEFPSVGFLQGGVFWNPWERRYEMFYHAGPLNRRALHLAYSQDLIHWEKPDLGLGAGNRFLPPGGWISGGGLRTAGTAFAVWLDLETTNPEERYKMICHWGHYKNQKPPGGMTHSLHVSSDGLHWSAPVFAGPAGDAQSFFYNPFRRKWVYSIKRYIVRNGKGLRARFYLESSSFLDGRDWSQAVYWTCADALDQPEPPGRYPAHPIQGESCQLYVLHGAAYESLMLGLHEIHRGPENDVCQAGNFPKLTDLELGFSRDGFHWHRPNRSGFITGTRQADDWDRAYLHGTPQIYVRHEDRLYFPYAGFSGFAPDGETPGMYRGGAIGMATLRRDGFASLRAAQTGGSLLTRPLLFSGSDLHVNADLSRGQLAAEVCDREGRPLSGYARKDCVSLVQANGNDLVLRWRHQPHLPAADGEPRRLRFFLLRGDLFAFWVHP